LQIGVPGPGAFRTDGVAKGRADQRQTRSKSQQGDQKGPSPRGRRSINPRNRCGLLRHAPVIVHEKALAKRPHPCRGKLPRQRCG